MKVLLHVNYCEGAGTLDELFGMALEFGYDGLELRWKYAFPDYTQEEYQAKVADFKQKNPAMELVFGGGIQFCRGNADEVKRDTEKYLEFLEWAHTQCGTTIMNGMTGPMLLPSTTWFDTGVNGSACAVEKDYEDAAAGLRVIGGRAGELGMKIALETHCCYLHDTAASCRKLMDMLSCPHVGLNYDHGNIFIHPQGESISEVFELIGDKIFYAHLKNEHSCGEHYVPAPLPYGSIDNYDIIKRLNVPMFATEFPSSGDGVIAAKGDIEYVRFLLNRIKTLTVNAER